MKRTYYYCLLLILLPLVLSARSQPGTHAPRTRLSAPHRNPAVGRAFERTHPCPSTGRTSGPCPGYVRDHVIPLACGGPDSPSNLQWQTTADAKAKDRWERRGCHSR
jgi:hypothetical protein